MVRNSKKEKFLESFSKLGVYFNCHRLPERSFFIKGKQFPVCARCTGVFIGQLFALVFILMILPSLNFFYFLLIGIFLGTMFVDWFLQYKGFVKSTNVRRLITGIFGGFGAIFLYYFIFLFLIKIIFK